MQEADVRARLRAFILSELIRDPAYPLRDDEPIVSSGMINSFSLAEIGVFAEEQFNVYIPDPDLTVEKMDTLDRMVVRILRDARP
jgi:acyl carrier protein